MIKKTTFLFALSLLITACGRQGSQIARSLDGGAGSTCTMLAAAGVTLRIAVPRASNGSPLVTGLQVKIANQAGGTPEILQPTASDFDAGTQRVIVSGAYENAGKFTVTVTLPGHASVQGNVQVGKGACHVQGQTVDVDLSH